MCFSLAALCMCMYLYVLHVINSFPLVSVHVQYVWVCVCLCLTTFLIVSLYGGVSHACYCMLLQCITDTVSTDTSEYMMMSYIYTGGTCISYCARSCLCEYNPFLITDKAHHTLFDFPFSNVLPSFFFFFFFLFVVIDGLFLPGLVHVRVHYWCKFYSC